MLSSPDQTERIIVQARSLLVDISNSVDHLILHQAHLVEYVDARIKELSFERSRFGSDKGLSVFLEGKIEALKEILPIIKGEDPQ